MRYDESAFETTGGLRLIERSWHPDGEPRALVAIVHGYAEHSGRYEYVGRRLAEGGFEVHALDLRGHGRSEGPRVFVRSFNEYLDDVDRFFGVLRARGAKPTFLLGHSMGGCVVTLSMLARKPAVDGVILSGAVLASPPNTPRLVTRVLMLLGRYLPKLKLRKLASNTVSRDPAIVALYDSDPLNYRDRMPAGLVAAMIRGTREIERRMEEITYPLLIMHGSADELSHPDGSYALYERASSKDKTLRIWDGLYHEILNEPERDQVIDEIAAWMEKRLPSAEPLERDADGKAV